MIRVQRGDTGIWHSHRGMYQCLMQESIFNNNKCMSSSPITSWQIDGETMKTVRDIIFRGSKITADGDCSCEIKTLAPWTKSYDKPRQHIKKQRQYFASKGPYSQSYGFSSTCVCM